MIYHLYYKNAATLLSKVLKYIINKLKILTLHGATHIFSSQSMQRAFTIHTKYHRSYFPKDTSQMPKKDNCRQEAYSEFSLTGDKG